MKRTLQITGLCLVLFIGYFFYSLATGKERVTTLCEQIKPGTTVEELRQYAEKNGFNQPGSLNLTSPRAYLAESRTMGRHICEVNLDNGTVKTTQYRSNL